jgi:hypothetical protein
MDIKDGENILYNKSKLNLKEQYSKETTIHLQ